MNKSAVSIGQYEEDRTAREEELFKEMSDSLMQFKETSTALIKLIQNKLTGDDLPLDKQTSCVALEQIQAELGGMDVPKELPSVCRCEATQTLPKREIEDDIDPDEPPGIECYKEPKLRKKKKYKYSPSIESKYLAHKRRAKCLCNREGINLNVDACLCKELPAKLNTPDEKKDLVVCSDLSGEGIGNITCRGVIPNEIAMRRGEGIDKNSLAWVQKPLSFFPDELPQDDTHPLIIKTDDYDEPLSNSLGVELWNAMMEYESNTAQIFEYAHESETYAEYAKKCAMVASKLRKELKSGDIIGIYAPNYKNSYVPYIAGLLNGNTVVVYDVLSEKNHLMDCLKGVTPSIMFVGDHELIFLQECMREAQIDFKVVIVGDTAIAGLTHFKYYLDDSAEDELDNFTVDNVEDLDSTCVICFTGGVAKSKAVCLSHKIILTQCFRLIACQYILPVILNFLELYQITSLLVLFAAILRGSTRVIIREFDEYFVWLLVQKYEINAVYLYPHHLIALSELQEPDEDTSSLYYIFTTGERLKTNAVKRLKKDLLHTTICQLYENAHIGGYITMFDFSRTEDGLFCYFQEESCGRPIDGVWYKIQDLKTGKILPHSTPGELFVKPNLMANGHFINNTEQPLTLKDWIKTGDYVYYDKYQCFYFISRIRDLITYRDTIIIPFKLENILSNHHSISEAVVYPITHVQDGQHAAAVIALKDGQEVHVKDLEDWVNNRLSAEEQLRGGLKVVKEIAHGSNGRINRDAFSSTRPVSK